MINLVLKGTVSHGNVVTSEKTGQRIAFMQISCPQGSETQWLPMRAYEGEPGFDQMANQENNRRVIVRGTLKRRQWLDKVTKEKKENIWISPEEIIEDDSTR